MIIHRFKELDLVCRERAPLNKLSASRFGVVLATLGHDPPSHANVCARNQPTAFCYALHVPIPIATLSACLPVTSLEFKMILDREVSGWPKNTFGVAAVLTVTVVDYAKNRSH